jgi:hypothetical protein
VAAIPRMTKPARVIQIARVATTDASRLVAKFPDRPSMRILDRDPSLQISFRAECRALIAAAGAKRG